MFNSNKSYYLNYILIICVKKACKLNFMFKLKSPMIMIFFRDEHIDYRDFSTCFIIRVIKADTVYFIS